MLRPRCGCIDVHTHVVPFEFPKYAGAAADAAWPSMVDARPCHRHVMISGSVYRTVSDRCWDVARRIEDMDATGVARQVLSPMPELLGYWLEADDGLALARFLNDAMAAMVAAAPARFSALAAAPLQDVDRAIGELERAVRELGLAGVEVGSNVNGRPIGHPAFRPFFEAAQRLGAAVFVHPLRPAGMDRLVGPATLQQVLAFPGEIGLAAASLITGGTLAACPGLRIAFSHGGGSLQALVPRLQHAWQSGDALREAVALEPVAAARAMWYDDLLYSEAAIESLVRLVGDTQVMAGSDFPFSIMDREPARRIDALALDDAARDRLRGGNARRWLALASEGTTPA